MIHATRDASSISKTGRVDHSFIHSRYYYQTRTLALWVVAMTGGGGDDDDDGDTVRDARSQRLLAQSVKHTKALQQLAREKEELHEALAEQDEALRASEAARTKSEERVAVLEHAIRAMRLASDGVLAPSAAAPSALGYSHDCT